MYAFFFLIIRDTGIHKGQQNWRNFLVVRWTCRYIHCYEAIIIFILSPAKRKAISPSGHLAESNTKFVYPFNDTKHESAYMKVALCPRLFCLSCATKGKFLPLSYEYPSHLLAIDYIFLSFYNYCLLSIGSYSF